MDNHEKQPVNLNAVLAVYVKTAVLAALVLGALYMLNYQMTAFTENERMEQTAQRVLQMEQLRLQEDYDREVAVSLAFSDISCHYDGQFREIFEKHVNAEYIFIGTSHVTHGVTPESFEKSGKRFFNFALNGSNPSYYVWWYNDVFKAKNYRKPTAIIFGVNWFMFDTNWLWRRP
ncbi:MAG: hypothetical protein FWH24_04465, partial [Oscillospiraceae bacterium]|nr:hypothetical protein [Oscillospiraceae bacterium]